MDAILNALGGILLKAIPTFVLLVLLHLYLKGIFYKPLDRIRQKRYEATEGARKRAEESMQVAAAKMAQYEEALRAAKAGVYQTQENLHRELQEQQAAELNAARQQAEAAVREAKAALHRDVEAAKAGLAADSESLASEIVESILERSAA